MIYMFYIHITYSMINLLFEQKKIYIYIYIYIYILNDSMQYRNWQFSNILLYSKRLCIKRLSYTPGWIKCQSWIDGLFGRGKDQYNISTRSFPLRKTSLFLRYSNKIPLSYLSKQTLQKNIFPRRLMRISTLPIR